VGDRPDLDPDRRGPGLDLRHGRSLLDGSVGIHAARRATRFEALEPLRQGVRACFGAFADGVAGGLKLRHDHGSQFTADDYQRELAFLGIASSPAFVREPEGNGCVEQFILTLKENLLWVRRFDTVEELRLALHAFKQTYNLTWIVERHRYQLLCFIVESPAKDLSIIRGLFIRPKYPRCPLIYLAYIGANLSARANAVIRGITAALKTPPASETTPSTSETGLSGRDERAKGCSRAFGQLCAAVR
jgi:hypothetical protein